MFLILEVRSREFLIEISGRKLRTLRRIVLRRVVSLDRGESVKETMRRMGNGWGL